MLSSLSYSSSLANITDDLVTRSSEERARKTSKVGTVELEGGCVPIICKFNSTQPKDKSASDSPVFQKIYIDISGFTNNIATSGKTSTAIRFFTIYFQFGLKFGHHMTSALTDMKTWLRSVLILKVTNQIIDFEL